MPSCRPIPRMILARPHRKRSTTPACKTRGRNIATGARPRTRRSRRFTGDLTIDREGWCAIPIGQRSGWAQARIEMSKDREVLVHARGRWEFATIEHNTAKGVDQWVRRDSSYIIDYGDEDAVAPVPPRPRGAKARNGRIYKR